MFPSLQPVCKGTLVGRKQTIEELSPLSLDDIKGPSFFCFFFLPVIIGTSQFNGFSRIFGRNVV